MIEHINEKIFDEKIKTGLVLVDFWAVWCGPCRMEGEELAELDKDNIVKICKVDVDENENLAERFNINAIPDMILFKDGVPVENLVGFRDKKTLTEIIKKYL